MSVGNCSMNGEGVLSSLNTGEREGGRDGGMEGGREGGRDGEREGGRDEEGERGMGGVLTWYVDGYFLSPPLPNVSGQSTVREE